MNWYLVSCRPNKRDLFLKQLDFEIDKNQLRDLFLDKISPSDTIYKDMVLLHISDLSSARIHLKKIEQFQKIEPRALSECQIQQFLDK